MRIAVSGTHCTGKSTLIEDFLARHPDYAHEPEPYDWLDQASAEPSADDFFRQLEISAERLSAYPPGSCVIAERSPLDFVAYIRALSETRLAARALELAQSGLEQLDLVVVLPLNEIDAPADEDLPLREAMHEHLLELVAELDVNVVELSGTPAKRLAALEQRIRDIVA